MTSWPEAEWHNYRAVCHRFPLTGADGMETRHMILAHSPPSDAPVLYPSPDRQENPPAAPEIQRLYRLYQSSLAAATKHHLHRA